MLASASEQYYDILTKFLPKESKISRVTQNTLHMGTKFEADVSQNLSEAIQFLITIPERLTEHEYLLMQVLNHLIEEWDESYLPMACDLLKALGTVLVKEEYAYDI